MNFGKAFRTIRLHSGKNQSEVARKMNTANKKLKMSQTKLSQIEQGHKKPSKEVLHSFAKVFHITPQVVIAAGMEKKDVPKAKQKLFKALSPVLDAVLEGVVQTAKPRKK